MQEVKKNTLALSKYFVSLPHPAKTTIAILLLSIFFGAVLGALKGSSDVFGIVAGAGDGVLLLAIPAILSSIILFLLRKKAIFRRAIFLGAITAACYGVFYIAALALSRYFAPAANLVFVGFGVAFALWYFLLVLAFGFRRSAFAFATMQLALFAFFYLTQSGIGVTEGSALLIAKALLSSLAFIAAAYFLFYVISAPMKKNLGISSMDALSMFLSQWLYGEKDLEEVFEEIGEEVETLVWLCEFKGKQSTLFVVPHIHYGPFGNLGGSEFTSMIADALKEKGREVFVFHGTATHDFNPVSSDEIGKVVSACKSALSSLKREDGKMAFSACKIGSVTAQACRISDSAFISYSRAPKTTEDVNFGLGLALMEKAKKFTRCAGIVDAHNAETGDISSVEVGSPIGFEMLDATEKLLLKKEKQESFLFGSSSAQLDLETMGRNGLKLALFARGNRMNAMLLADSNGIVPSFRDELIGLMARLGREKGFECKGEVMTTDTHQINTVRGILNPLGSDRREDVRGAVGKLFADAEGKLERVKFGAAEKRFRLNVFGSGQSTEIASTINAVVAIMRFALPVMLIGTAVLLIWGLARI